MTGGVYAGGAASGPLPKGMMVSLPEGQINLSLSNLMQGAVICFLCIPSPVAWAQPRSDEARKVRFSPNTIKTCAQRIFHAAELHFTS